MSFRHALAVEITGEGEHDGLDRVVVWRICLASESAIPMLHFAYKKRDLRWIEPRLVVQVRYTRWTSNGVLRHPTYCGLREDKAPAEAVRDR